MPQQHIVCGCNQCIAPPRRDGTATSLRRNCCPDGGAAGLRTEPGALPPRPPSDAPDSRLRRLLLASDAVEDRRGRCRLKSYGGRLFSCAAPARGEKRRCGEGAGEPASQRGRMRLAGGEGTAHGPAGSTSSNLRLLPCDCSCCCTENTWPASDSVATAALPPVTYASLLVLRPSSA